MIAFGGEHDLFPAQDDAGRRARRLEAFHPAYRRYVADLTSCSRELEDLADSFPALLFALASGYATEDKRGRCCDLIGEGTPLRAAADVLGLAWWLRRLPANAFAAPLPAFPLDQDFSLRIANLVPREERATPVWLLRVGHALEAAGPEYALWIARQSEIVGPPDDQLAFMAAWAWFSGKPGLKGHDLLRRAWTP